MRRAPVLLLALAACGGAPFRDEVAALGDAGDELPELAVGDALARPDAGSSPVDAPDELGPGVRPDAGDERRAEGPDASAPDAPTFSPEAGPEAAVDAGHVTAVCCNLGTSCHSVAAACPIMSNGTPTCYCGSARACVPSDLGVYCYLIDGCSGVVALCPGGDQ
jgi:hypothetical protein